MHARVWSAAVGLAALASSSPARAQSSAALARAAHLILEYQAADGAIAMDRGSVPQTHVLPYVANYAARGLVEAYGVTRQSRLLSTARRWVLWYEGHMNGDGTVYDYSGAHGSWKATGDYDSTDAYAATYLSLVWKMQRTAPDATWLRERSHSIERAVAAIRLTLQPSGLTLAKPTWPVMYTMDNTETTVGLRAAQGLATELGKGAVAAQYARMAARMEAAVGVELWDGQRESYRIGLQTNGAPEEGLDRWYPDVMANLMAIAWLPRSERNRALYARIKARFAGDLPQSIATRQDLSRLEWWALAAQGAGDHSLAATIANRLAGSMDEVEKLATPDDLGHICEILASQLSSRPTGKQPDARQTSRSIRFGAGMPALQSRDHQHS